MSPDGDTTISAIFRSKLRNIAPSRQSPRSCKHDFGSLLAGIKVDCSVLTHSHNRYPNSQSGLSPYLFIRVSPSNVYVIADASILHNIAAVRDFYSKFPRFVIPICPRASPPQSAHGWRPPILRSATPRTTARRYKNNNTACRRFLPPPRTRCSTLGRCPTGS